MAGYKPTQRKQAGSAPRAGKTQTWPSTLADFPRLVLEQLPAGGPKSSTMAGEDLAHLGYAAEIAVKNAALASFWRKKRLPARPEAVLASPRPRGYRTTSKRRVALVGTAAHLFLGERSADRETPVFVESTLEPAEHSELYRFLQTKLSEPVFRSVAEHLSWLVIRGSYIERAVIFNVDTLNGPLVRKLKILGRHLTGTKPPVVAAFVYLDENGSDYYLEARRPTQVIDFKKLFGPETLRVAYGDLRLGFHPTSFCQVNESIVPQMLQLADELLEPRGNDRLIDLYCGYGMFSHALAGRVREVIGLDAAGPSIEAARENARRLRRGSTRFIASRINTGAIERLPAPARDEIILLDPPRDGTELGVIAALAARRPRRVLHAFCSVDEITAALGQWAAGGYVPQRVVPLDMFPGTPHLEVFIQLAPAAREL